MEVVKKNNLEHSLGNITYVVAYPNDDESISTSVPTSLGTEEVNRVYIKFQIDTSVRLTFGESEEVFFRGSENKCAICKKTTNCISLNGEQTTRRRMWKGGNVHCCSDCLKECRDLRDDIISEIESEDILSSLI